MFNKEKKFLIRSSGDILGPYTKDEVTNLIKNKKISVFDEVTEPFKIWMYLEHHSDFEKIVNSMNIQASLTNFLTQISSKISISKSRTREDTQKNTQKDILQEGATSKNLPETNFKPISDTIQSEVKKTHLQPTVQTTERTALSPNLKYKKKKLNKKIGFAIKFSWQLIAISSFLVVGFILYQISYIPIKKKNKLLTELNLKGKNYYKAGDFKQALPFFEKAQAYLTEEDKFSFAVLLLQNNQLEKSLMIKEEITNPAIQQKDSWTLFEGLSYFYSRKYSKAEISFHNVISKNNNQTLNQALLNLALLKLENRQYNAVINQINQLLRRSFERDIVWYLKALYLLNQKKMSELENYLINDLALETKKQSFIIEFKQELLFLLAYTYMKAGKMEEKNEVIKKLLNQDPYFSEEFNYSPLIAKNKLNWKLLYPYCNEIFYSNTEENLTQALYGFCLIKTNQIQQASSYIERAKAKDPGNSLFLSLYVYLLMSEKKSHQKIEQTLSTINYDNQLTKENALSFIIKARFFEQAKYWDSALLVWKDLINQNVGHISGLSGISFNSYQIGETTEGDFYRKKVLTRYPYHTKVLPFKEIP